MQVHLSITAIRSFQGNVLPLYLVSDADLSKEDIRFQSENEAVVILHTFKRKDPQSVAHCALLTLVGVGQTRVRADYKGQSYFCDVIVREMRRAAQDFVDDILLRADEGLTANLAEVRKTRASLKQQANPAQN